MKGYRNLRAYSFWLRFGGIVYGEKKPRKAHKAYDSKNLNKSRECARRKRQIARGMPSSIWRGKHERA